MGGKRASSAIASRKPLVPYLLLLLEFQTWLTRGGLSTLALFLATSGDGAAADVGKQGRVVAAYYAGYSAMIVPAGCCCSVFGELSSAPVCRRVVSEATSCSLASV